ncbi:MAG: tRNA (adenosine(37)-N6)-threonylcarbamoyltransferase complex ATPase subunit type 1 TsaE [Christensenellales bacterium]|jgi:tRNA threonylcarbamoyladenosine biosynthesis protein TsaE
MAKEIFLGTKDETLKLGKKTASCAKGGDIILLRGDLGAGKTCFVRGFASFFSDEAALSVTSPTFALMNIYETEPVIYHFDLYRLQSADDVVAAGFDEYIFGGGISLIEWPQVVASLLDGEIHSEIFFEYAGEDGSSRKATVSGPLEDCF